MIEQDYGKIVSDLRQNFNMGKTKSLEYRKNQLKSLRTMYEEHSLEFVEALSKDLRKSVMESFVTEINILINDANHMLDNIDEWVKPEKIPANSVTLLDSTSVYHDPYGVILILGAWNYPLLLAALPLSGAIAAGNCAIIKPSEVATAVEALMVKYLPLYLDQDCYRVITGGVEETTELLKQRFDYILFTGSTAVGKIIGEAANKHLTPTTLELGGKSPLYLDDTVNFEIAVRRIIWGKCINLGQTCVAPDYLLCSKQVQEKFILKAKEVMKEFYGDKLQECPDLCRIINDRNFKRVTNLIKDGTVVIGGNYDADDKWIEPTILVDVDPNSKLMQEEIFGPLLPIINAESVHDAIKFINEKGEKPLTIYVFSSSSKVQDHFKKETLSGGLCINEVLVQFSLSCLPFGGVGASGMGAYHGKASYDAFTHRKSVFNRGYGPIFEWLGRNRYPPFSDKKYKFLTVMLKERALPSLKPLCYLATFGLGMLSLYIGQMIYKKECQSLLIDRILAVQNIFTRRFGK